MEAVEYIVGKGGERKAVILPIEEYEELIEDLRVIAERREEGTVLLEEFKSNIWYYPNLYRKMIHQKIVPCP